MAPAESAAPVAVFQTASFCAQASHLRALDPPRIASRELGRYSEPIWAAENPWAAYLRGGKTLGALFWLRKNLGQVFWLRKNNAHVHILEI